jgi:hypothetical protein
MKLLAAQCPQCGANLNFDCGSNDGTSVNCYYCATPFLIKRPKSQMVEVDSNIANPLGNTAVNSSTAVGRMKSKQTAIVLCLIFGWFGAHKFYEEKIGWGLFYLFTFGGFWVGWIIDLFVLATKPETYYVKSKLGTLMKQLEGLGNIK